VADSLKILRRTVSEDITLKVESGDEALPVMIDPGHVNQILMNLVVNARDAMPSGGTIDIRTARVELSPDRLAVHEDREPGAYAQIAVSDHGVGMTEEQQSRILEPFFTTKAPGKGTGLGLATVYGIVAQNAGIIEVESAPGTGTTVSVFFPIVAADRLPAAGDESEGAVSGGSERIVVVEDETAVRDLAREILETMGYEVVVYASPGEVLTAFASGEAARPDLLITDVIMPGMSGVEMVRRLQEMTGEIPVLLMSGYADDALAEKGLAEPTYLLMNKPFSLQELCTKVREILDRR